MPTFNRALFEEGFKKKYDIAQQEANAKMLEQQNVGQMYKDRFAPGGLEERQTGVQYGPGGMGDRNNLAMDRRQAGVNATNMATTGMQYGPGGSADRTNTAHLAGINSQVASQDRRTIAETPYWAGQGRKLNAEGNALERSQSFNDAINTKGIAELTKVSTSLAKPRTASALTNPFAEMDIQNEQWQPFGADSPNKNWLAKRARNIGEAPRRFLNEMAMPLRESLRMP
jgi:hypothetical protein